MKSIPPKKLLKYSVAASGFLALASTAQADIVYTNVNPDAYLHDNLLDIDLNSDGIVDVRVKHDEYTSSSGSGPYSNWMYTYLTAKAEGMAGAALLKSGSSPFMGPLLGAVPAGVSIGAADTFTSNGVMGYSFYYRWWAFSSYFVSHTATGLGGDWNGMSDRYLGVKFQIAGADHFGWIRCDVSSGYTNIVVKSFAYEDTPSTSIIAGETGVICDATTAPAGLSTIPGASSIRFNWTSVAGSVGCQVNAGPVGGGFPYTLNLLGSDVNYSGPILFGSLPAGTYQAKVRCACEITPVPLVTPYSNTVNFTVPEPRVGDAVEQDLHPNPASDQIQLIYKASKEERVTFQITNIAGQELFTETAIMFEGEQQVSFDVSDFNSGIYLLHISNGENAITEKFEISR